MRRPPSRLMPPRDSRPSPTAGEQLRFALSIALLAGAALALLWIWLQAAWKSPVSTLLATALLAAAFAWLYRRVNQETQQQQQHLQALAQRRNGQSICQFARQANCRQHDPWVVRAVYEELAHAAGALSGSAQPVPVHWDDNLTKTLYLDGDALDMDIAPEIARRAGRCIKNTRHNPWYGKVRTAGDLVQFFNAQPRATPA